MQRVVDQEAGLNERRFDLGRDQLVHQAGPAHLLADVDVDFRHGGLEGLDAVVAFKPVEKALDLLLYVDGTRRGTVDLRQLPGDVGYEGVLVLHDLAREHQ